jgi:hypothetical protein
VALPKYLVASDAVNNSEIFKLISLDNFLKFQFGRSDKQTNGDEKSEPGSGVSGQVFRGERSTRLFAGSEDDARRAQQASGFDRWLFKAEAGAARRWQLRRQMPALAGSHFLTESEISKWQ